MLGLINFAVEGNIILMMFELSLGLNEFVIFCKMFGMRRNRIFAIPSYWFSGISPNSGHGSFI